MTSRCSAEAGNTLAPNPAANTPATTRLLISFLLIVRTAGLLPGAPQDVPRREWLNLSRRLRLARKVTTASAGCNVGPSRSGGSWGRGGCGASDIEGSIGGRQGELEPWKGFRARTCMWC